MKTIRRGRRYLKFGYGYNEARRNKPYYKTSNEDGSNKCYCTWFNMMKRCYDPNSRDYEMYKDCEVCQEWHNFQNFAEWWDKEYYEIPNANMSLDKDILEKGNRLYSPETCCIVPLDLNVAFVWGNGTYHKNIRVKFEKYKDYLPRHVVKAIKKRLRQL